MLGLQGGCTEDLEMDPNLWVGVGPAFGDAATALVGGHREVADVIESDYLDPPLSRKR